ncbi:MAG: DUF58 domain-containing protein [Lachnospiraceae bacterium]|nr:DUF58 domain-containing protein [Lachnospiraceae bacterium]
MELVLVLVLVCLIYGIQHLYFRKHWNRELQVGLTFQEKGVHAGDACGLEENIINGKHMPLPTLQVKFRTDASFRFAENQNAVTTDYYYRRDLFSVGGKRKVTRRLKFRAGQRGYFQISEVDILVKNFFLTAQYSWRQTNETALYVYPYKRDTGQFDLLYHQLMGEMIAKQRLEEDPFAFRGIREYRATDPMHRINWKSSARNGSLLVNCFESTTTQTVCILLDGQTQSVYAARQMQETVISVASSVAGRLLQSGIPVALHSNARDILTKELVQTESGSHRSHMETIDCGLARIDLKEPMHPFSEMIRDTVEQGGSGACYLVITSDDRPVFRQEYRRQKENGVEIFGMILCESREQWNPLEGLYPWEVD